MLGRPWRVHGRRMEGPSRESTGELDGSSMGARERDRGEIEGRSRARWHLQIGAEGCRRDEHGDGARRAALGPHDVRERVEIGSARVGKGFGEGGLATNDEVGRVVDAPQVQRAAVTSGHVGIGASGTAGAAGCDRVVVGLTLGRRGGAVLGHLLKGVRRVLRGLLGRCSKVHRGCSEGAQRVLRGCSDDAQRVLGGCSDDAQRVLITCSCAHLTSSCGLALSAGQRTEW